MRFVFPFLFVLICGCYFTHAQQIVVNNSVGLQQLIEDNLVQDSCVEITNITSSVNGNSSGISSYASFNSGSSNFPFQNGIMLSTGNAASGGNGLITNTLSEGSSSWGTDPDIETALGISNTLNATSIAFDLVSTSGLLQFNYLFASEEYFDTYPCNVSDGFVFLIKESASTGSYQNIALVPGTSTPVNTNTIHSEITNTNNTTICGAENEQYFEGLNVGDTNYNGRTTVLTASTTITPNTKYRIKLIIADQSLSDYDSAVFIEANSFKTVDLGPDISTCASSVDLNADIQNNSATYKWFYNNAEISGATSAIYPAFQDGTYSVRVTTSLNAGTCFEDDDINVTLNTEETITAISDYALCDESTDNSGTATFDLSSKDSELFNNSPFTNFTHSYHYSEPKARNNTDEITAPISNATNQTIHVRIQDLDSNCFAYTSFNLVVNTAPTIITPDPLELCDNDDDDGIIATDLTDNDASITGGNPNLSVTYHHNQPDADSGNNAISTTYINFSSPFKSTIHVRVVDTQTGCVNFTTLTINITTGPPVDRSTQYLDACDRDLDGFAVFNLRDVLPDLLLGLPNPVTTTFHEQRSDALSGSNPIPINEETSYPNVVPEEQILFIRVEDDVTKCASIVPLEIHTNFLITATNTSEFALCDNNTNTNDAFDFFLGAISAEITRDLPNADDITITFYETNSYTSPITSPTFTVTGPDPETLYIRLENTVSGCIEETEIALRINPVLVFKPLTPVKYCDTDDDGIINIDLHTLDDLITGDDSSFSVTYFLTDPTNTPPPSRIDFLTNTQPIESVFALIQSNDTPCNSINEFNIEVVTAPPTKQPNDWIVCDDYDGDPNGFAIINLDDKITETVSNRTNLNITVHTSYDDADTKTTPIDTDLTTYDTDTQTFYIRVEDAISSTGCYSIISFEAIVNTIPVFPENGISNFPLCVENSTSSVDFYFEDKDADILNGQIGKEVYYFLDETDAIDRNLNNAIEKDQPFNSGLGATTIFVRVENTTGTSCYAISSFDIIVATPPVYTLPSFIECDDSTGDEKFTFNLDDKAAEINASSTDDLSISFHRTVFQAENNVNPLSSPYTNSTNPESIFARIESSYSLCVTVENLPINVIPLPEVTPAAPLILCDTDNNNTEPFDLTLANFEITSDRPGLNESTIAFFENEDDVLDNTLEIPNPNSYSSTSKTIYIKITAVSGCHSVIPLDLIVNKPPVTNTLGTVPICDTPTNTYDLSLIDDLLIKDTNAVTISYYNDQGIAIPNIYNYTAANHTLIVSIEDNITNCYTTQSFNLQIHQNPVANLTPGLLGCDDDFDGYLEFDLHQITANNILGTQDPRLHTITYYTEYLDAISGTFYIDPIYAAANGDIIFARIENKATGCYDITDFSARVNPLPVIPINDIIPLCIYDLPLVIDADTGYPDDTYLWSTGATTPQIILNNASEIGDYWVRATIPNIIGSDCEYTHMFSVIESQQAAINFTTTVDFADPNSITIDVSGIGDYVYVLDDGEPQVSNVFENVTYGVHTVTIRDLNGCLPTTKEVVVIDIPKFFTPNNDYTFDTWHIVGIEEIPGTLIYIYNRHGKLLKTLTHRNTGWDGTYNGQDMPTDDYWFLAKVIQEGEAFDVKGHFTLKR